MNKKIRRGNDIEITWSLYDSENDPYIVDGRNFVVELCNEYGKIQPSNVTSEGNRIHFYYRGKDQKYLGSYALKYIENGGQVDMVTFDTKDAFFIVAHSWQAVDAGETPETIQIEVVTIGSALLEKVGPRGYSAYEIAVQEGFVGTVDEWLASLNGDAAGFGEVDAEVDANIGTPEVEVSTSGPDTEKNIHFKFKNIKGEKGDDPVLTAGTDGTIYSDGQVLTEVIKDAKTQAGDDHSRAELDHTQASNDHTQAGSDHSTASGDHTQAGNDHTQAVSDHGVAAADHTQAGLDHNASTEATAKANNVNATIDGTVVTITDKNGVSTSVDIGFDIYKTYASVAAMNADAANVSEGKFVMIATTDQTSTENARLYVRNENAASSESPFTFLCDLDQAATSAWADWFENYKPTIEADHTRAENDHTLASSDHGTAAADHTQSGNDHTRAEGDHSTAADDHTLAGTDHNTAASDHTLAGTDHQTAASDHTLAGTDHQTAASDHSTASNDHTTAGNDHTTAGNDHTRAESDHTRAESDHAVVEGYNTRLTNVEGEVSQLGQKVVELGGGTIDVTDTLEFEQGGISSMDGSDQASSQQIRSGFIDCKSITVTVTNGQVYVYAWNGNTYLSAQGWKTGTNTYSIANATKYKVVFKRNTNTNLSPSQFSEVGAIVYVNYTAEFVKVTPQTLTSSEKQVARENIGAMDASKESELKEYADTVMRTFSYSVEGKGSTVVTFKVVLIPGRKYLICFTGDWAYSGADTKLGIKWNTGTSVYNYNGGTEIPSQLYLSVPASVTYQNFYIRANSGVTVNFDIVDITTYIENIITGIKPYANFSRIEGGWRVAVNSSTKFYNNNTNYALSPSTTTIDFTNADALLVFNSSDKTVTKKSNAGKDDIVLLDYRTSHKTFVGGCIYDYFRYSIDGNILPFVDVTGFKVTEYNEVSWDSLTVYYGNGTSDTFTSASYILSSSSSVLVLYGGSISVRNLVWLNNPGYRDAIILLQLRGDVLSDGLLYPFVQNQKLTSWYDDAYQLNIKRFGDQMKNVIWIPKADVRSNEGLNEAGVPVTGVPYSSVKEYLKFVGIDVSLHTFMTAINDIHSLMYTENVSKNNSASAYGRTYYGVNSICYFGSVCSGFVATSLGERVQNNSWEFQTNPNRYHIIDIQDEQNLRVGDIISEPGHCAIVTRIYRTLSGIITHIEVSEHGAPLQTTTYTTNSLKNRRLQTGIVYCRLNNISHVNKTIAYKASPFVLADGENLYVAPDFVYFDNANGRVFYMCTQANKDATFQVAKWSLVPVFSTGTQISVNNYRQYGENLYRCKVTHTPTEWDADKWEYVPGVAEWASYPYTYNDDIVTFAGDRAAFRTGDLIYINYAKGDYTTLQIYKDGTLIQSLSLADGYQMDVSSYCATAGMYKARLTDGTNYSRFTYFEVIDTTCSATWSSGIATVNFSSSNGKPIDVQIVEQSGFPICHYRLDGSNGTIKINPQAALYRQRHHYYRRYNDYSETIYARVVFAGEYGNAVNEMIELGTLTPITGLLILPNEAQDLGELTGSKNIILAEGVEGKSYTFSFKANSVTVNFLTTLGEIVWKDGAPSLTNGKTYVITVVNGFAKYDEY